MRTEDDVNGMEATIVLKNWWKKECPSRCVLNYKTDISSEFQNFSFLYWKDIKNSDITSISDNAYFTTFLIFKNCSFV